MSRYKIDPYLFSNEEKMVLKALRTLNTPLKIHKHTKIPRPTVYFLLERLKHRGLVKKQELAKKTIWLLRNNDSLVLSEIEDNQKLSNKTIRVYDTKNEIEDFLEKFVMADHVRFMALNGDNNPESWQKNIGSQNVIKFNNIINENNVVSDIISSEKFITENIKVLGDDWAESYKNKPTEYHIINGEYTSYTSQIVLKGDKIFLINMEKPIVIEISDKDMYKCFSSIFSFVKDKTNSQSLTELISKHIN